MKVRKHRFLESIAALSVSVLLAVFPGATETANGEAQEQVHLLAGYEANYEEFDELQIAEKTVYFKQRMIGPAIVQKDYVVYHFDRASEELLDVRTNWREDLPERLPQVISKEQAESLVEGDVRFCRLFYISPESHVFPIPTSENPCWVVETLNDDGNIVVTIIDAVEGKILGNGVPPPYTRGFSHSGPQYFEPCRASWNDWYRNARDWFNTMGYPTEAMDWAPETKIKSHIQSRSTAMYYELAHGGSSTFINDCTDDTSAGEIESWIAAYEKMPFTFIGSCGGMCETGDGTLSYEFRKGSNENTATVGYCGMGSSPCEENCWYAGYTIPWQGALFSYMNQGWTVKAAFDQANADYPGCSANSCMRFAGDETFAVVPVVLRDASFIFPIPLDGASGVSTDAILEWSALVWADFHDVYLGTVSAEVSSADTLSAGVYRGRQVAASYDPCGLDLDTVYYWRIDSGDDSDPCNPLKGDVFSFTTSKIVYVPAAYSTIQSAIDLAWEGVTIVISPGVYSGDGNRDIKFGGKALTVRSTDPNDASVVEATIINCQGSETDYHQGFLFNMSEGVDSVLAGLTITNAYGRRTGGGIMCANSSATISKCVISSSSAGEKGGGIYLSGGSPSITDCNITNNWSSSGGGIYFGGSNAIINNCTINGNYSEILGGGMCCVSGEPIISNCTISGNDSNDTGGGVYCILCDITITDCNIIDNRANFGGGVGNDNSGTITIKNCTISNNIAEGQFGDGKGGGLYNCYSDVNDCIISGNIARGDYGGGGGVSDSFGTISNCVISGNIAEGQSYSEGGGVCFYTGNIRNCTIVGNKAKGQGGGLCNYRGGISNCIIWDNVADANPQTTATPTYSCIQDWSGGGDGNIDSDPCFASAGLWDPNSTPTDANDDFWVDGDYHLQSAAGRWAPETNTWVIDVDTSVCIDSGDPGSEWSGELWPHGKHINMGAYGGTPQASMSLSEEGNIADLDADDTVDYLDVMLFGDRWLYQEVLLPEDFDRNGFVDFADFAILADNWLW